MRLIRPLLPLSCALLIMSLAPVTAAPITDAPFQELKSYDSQNRKPVEAINQMIREAPEGSPAWADIETRLIAVLDDPASTFAAKQEVGHMLRKIGTARSVPSLARMLTDDKLNNVARYALERNADPSAARALRDALATAKGTALIGVIDSIGNRGDVLAVPALRPLATDANADVANAAIAALGKMGAPTAVAILQALPNKSPFVYQALVSNADRMASQRLLARQALTLYRMVMQDKTAPAPARLAATHGLLVSDATGAMPLVLNLMRGDDTAMRALATRYVRLIPAGANVGPLVAGVERLPGAGEAQLLAALADRGERTLLPVLERAAISTDPDVRLAALRGFATMQGDAGAALLLAKTAAKPVVNADRDAARASLAAMRGAAVDQAIIAAIPTAEPAVKTELIQSLGQRYTKGVKPTLFKLADDTDAGVQNAVMNALRDLAGAEDYPTLVNLLLTTKSGGVRSAAEDLVLRVSKKVPTEGDRTSALIAGLNGGPLDAKTSILKVLGSIGGTQALNTVRSSLKDPDAQVQDAALRALSNAPDTEVMPDLLEIAKSDTNKVHQVLALRGYLRLADTLARRPNASPKLETYEPVIKLATEPQEKKTIISGLTRINTPESLALVASMLDDESVRNEAAQAAISIAKSIAGKNPKEAKAALDKVTATVKDDNIVKQANEVLKGIKTA